MNEKQLIVQPGLTAISDPFDNQLVANLPPGPSVYLPTAQIDFLNHTG